MTENMHVRLFLKLFAIRSSIFSVPLPPFHVSCEDTSVYTQHNSGAKRAKTVKPGWVGGGGNCIKPYLTFIPNQVSSKQKQRGFTSQSALPNVCCQNRPDPSSHGLRQTPEGLLWYLAPGCEQQIPSGLLGWRGWGWGANLLVQHRSPGSRLRSGEQEGVHLRVCVTSATTGRETSCCQHPTNQ